MRLVVVKDLKVFFFQVSHCAALFITDHNRHQYSVDVCFNLERRGLRLFCLLSGAVCAWKERQAPQDKNEAQLHAHIHPQFPFNFVVGDAANG